MSDGRLSFGSQFYGFCNGAFIIPLPRGCICVMNENSYAANGVKHCVRPCDMSGKSAAIIMRQMHHQVVVNFALLRRRQPSTMNLSTSQPGSPASPSTPAPSPSQNKRGGNPNRSSTTIKPRRRSFPSPSPLIFENNLQSSYKLRQVHKRVHFGGFFVWPGVN